MCGGNLWTPFLQYLCLYGIPTARCNGFQIRLHTAYAAKWFDLKFIMFIINGHTYPTSLCTFVVTHVSDVTITWA